MPSSHSGHQSRGIRLAHAFAGEAVGELAAVVSKQLTIFIGARVQAGLKSPRCFAHFGRHRYGMNTQRVARSMATNR